MSGVAASLQHELQKHSALLDGVLTHSQRRAVSAFIQAPADYFDAAPTFKQSYAPQSGQIFGILQQMLEEKCSLTDKEWEERQKTRQLEMEAVSKALAVLSGDDAHDLFTRTFSPALLQVD